MKTPIFMNHYQCRLVCMFSILFSGMIFYHSSALEQSSSVADFNHSLAFGDLATSPPAEFFVDELWIVPGGNGAATGNDWVDAPNSGRGMAFLRADAPGNTHGVDELLVLSNYTSGALVQVMRASDGQNLGHFPVPGTGDPILEVQAMDTSDDGHLFINGLYGSVIMSADDTGATFQKIIAVNNDLGHSRTLSVVGNVADGTCTMFLGQFLTVEVWTNSFDDPTSFSRIGAVDVSGQGLRDVVYAIAAVDDDAFLVCSRHPEDPIKRYVKTGPGQYSFDSDLTDYMNIWRGAMVWNGNALYAVALKSALSVEVGLASIPGGNLPLNPALDKSNNGLYDGGVIELGTNLNPALCMNPTTGVVYGYSRGNSDHGGVFALYLVEGSVPPPTPTPTPTPTVTPTPTPSPTPLTNMDPTTELWLVPGGQGFQTGNDWMDAPVAGRGIVFMPVSASGNTRGVDEVLVLTGTTTDSLVQILRATDGHNLGSFPVPGTGDAALPLYNMSSSDDGCVFVNGVEGSVMMSLNDKGENWLKIIDQSGTGLVSRTIEAVGRVDNGTCTVFVAKTLAVQVWANSPSQPLTFSLIGEVDTTLKGLSWQIMSVAAQTDEAFCVMSPNDNEPILRYSKVAPGVYEYQSSFTGLDGYVKHGLAWDGDDLFSVALLTPGDSEFVLYTESDGLSLSLPEFDNNMNGFYDGGSHIFGTSIWPDVTIDPTTGVVFGYVNRYPDTSVRGGVFALRIWDESAPTYIDTSRTFSEDPMDFTSVTGGVFAPVSFDFASNALVINPNGWNTFGFWQSSQGLLDEMQSDWLYRVSARMSTDIAACDVPQVRLRTLSANNWQGTVLGLISTGDCSRGLGADPRTVELAFSPEGGAVGQNGVCAFDLLNFDPFDATDGSVMMEYIDVSRIKWANVQLSPMTPLFTFEGTMEGWLSGGATPLIAPEFLHEDGSLWMVAKDVAAGFGFWQSPPNALTLNAGDGVLLQFHTGASPLSGVKGHARARVFTTDNQVFQYVDVPVESENQVISLVFGHPGGEPVSLGMALDLVTMDPGIPGGFTLRLDSVGISRFKLP